MKLVAINPYEVIAEFIEDRVVIHRPLLQKEMEKIGIAVPSYKRESFAGKAIVKLDDPLFAKAFQEVFFALKMNTALYRWEK
ncbi:MAG: hypothetical protein FJZ58_00560 [Chlamydiae bacterium]|nr:hypothetical protein [Chlamydiota bacterium]